MKKTNQEFLIQLESVNPNIEVLELYQNTNTRLSCCCKKCNHIWKARPTHLLEGHGCPKCGGSMRLTNDEFIARLKRINPYLSPIDTYINAKTKISCKCERCNSIIQVSPDKLLYGEYQCKECTKRYKTSFPEQAIYFYLVKRFPKDCIKNRYREISNISELDIYIPSINVGIEYDGVYWHKESRKKGELLKYQACKTHGIRLIRVIECSNKQKELICDVYADIVVKRYSPYTFSTLDASIYELFSSLEILVEEGYIDTLRDAAEIQSLYFSELEKNTIKELYPELVDEWLQEKNGEIKPNMVVYGSNTPYYWKCKTCGYIWRATPADARYLRARR